MSYGIGAEIGGNLYEAFTLGQGSDVEYPGYRRPASAANVGIK